MIEFDLCGYLFYVVYIMFMCVYFGFLYLMYCVIDNMVFLGMYVFKILNGIVVSFNSIWVSWEIIDLILLSF